MTRILVSFHRRLGIAFAAMFCVWFASGGVMLFVGFPQLTMGERLLGLAPLPRGWRPPPGNVSTELGAAGAWSTLRLGELLGRPVYHVRSAADGKWRTIRADSGEWLGAVTETEAIEVARGFGGRLAGGAFAAAPDPSEYGLSRGRSSKSVATLVEIDQWSVSASLNQFRPFYRVALGDAAGTELYVSRNTGEVVRDTTRWERSWNYAGAVVHWLYFTPLRRHPSAWRLVGQLVSGLAILAPASGLAAGILWWLRRRRNDRSKKGSGIQMRVWHYRLGLVFGLIAASWIVSGFFSFRLTALFDDGEPRREHLARWEGKRAPEPAIAARIDEALTAEPGFEPVEGEWIQVAGRVLLLLRNNRGSSWLAPGPAFGSRGWVEKMDVPWLLDQARGLIPDAALVEAEMVESYDSYYYSAAMDLGDLAKPLPVLRVRFDDPSSSWFHIDPRTGRLLDRLTINARLYRWVFDGIHKLDFPWLARRRCARLGIMLGLLAGGFGISASGVLVWYFRKRGAMIRRQS